MALALDCIFCLNDGWTLPYLKGMCINAFLLLNCLVFSCGSFLDNSIGLRGPGDQVPSIAVDWAYKIIVICFLARPFWEINAWTIWVHPANFQASPKCLQWGSNIRSSIFPRWLRFLLLLGLLGHNLGPIKILPKMQKSVHAEKWSFTLKNGVSRPFHAVSRYIFVSAPKSVFLFFDWKSMFRRTPPFSSIVVWFLVFVWTKQNPRSRWLTFVWYSNWIHSFWPTLLRLSNTQSHSVLAE